jgi:Ca2+-binding EF-hand superfamily protein
MPIAPRGKRGAGGCIGGDDAKTESAMNSRTKWTIAAVAVALTAGGAIAAEGFKRHGFEERAKFGREMFARLDANSDGAVAREDLNSFLKARFAEADADSSASVSRAEIVAAIEKQAELERARRFAGRIADRMVAGLDIDENGAVAAAEVENRIGKLFALADIDDDGKVEQAELKRLRDQAMQRGHGGMGPGHGWGRWRDGASE